MSDDLYRDLSASFYVINPFVVEKNFINLLLNRIRCDSINSRYKERIDNFFQNIDNITNEDQMYEEIYQITTDLWKGSRKNARHISNLRNFEPILKRNKHYRDHFMHSFNVFLLGYYIMNKIKQLAPNIVTRSGDFNLIWMLASTYHDAAYPLQLSNYWINDLMQSFLGINPNVSVNIGHILPPIYMDFMKMICVEHNSPGERLHEFSSYSAIDWKLYSVINQKFIEKDHGVLSSLMLAHQLFIDEDYSSFEGGLWGDFPTNHIPACHAICLHNIPGFKIKFDRHPYAFLLILLDEIQDWGRPSRSHREIPFSLKDISIENNANKLALVIDLIIKDAQFNNLKKKLKDRLVRSEYLDIKIRQCKSSNHLCFNEFTL